MHVHTHMPTPHHTAMHTSHDICTHYTTRHMYTLPHHMNKVSSHLQMSSHQKGCQPPKGQDDRHQFASSQCTQYCNILIVLYIFLTPQIVVTTACLMEINTCFRCFLPHCGINKITFATITINLLGWYHSQLASSNDINTLYWGYHNIRVEIKHS